MSENLLLYRFIEVMEQDPYSFYQFDVGSSNYSEAIWVDKERRALKNAIAHEVESFSRWLGYFPFPVDVTTTIPINYRDSIHAQNITIPDSAFLNYIGEKVRVSIEDSLVLTYQKVSGYNKTASFTFQSDVGTDFRFYKTKQDTKAEKYDEDFRVFPQSITDLGDNLYLVKFSAPQLFKPEKVEEDYVDIQRSNRNSLDATIDTNFVSSLDVCACSVNTNNAVTIKTISGSNLASSAFILDSYNATIVIDDSVSLENVDQVTVKCNLGLPLVKGFVSPSIEDLILRRARLSTGINVKLAEAKIDQMWQYDYIPANSPVNPNSGSGGVGDTSNPIGHRNIDVITFKRLIALANWRGSITDKRFWSHG